MKCISEHGLNLKLFEVSERKFWHSEEYLAFHVELGITLN